MTRIAACLILPIALLAVGCIDFSGSTRPDAAKPKNVEEVKVPPKPLRKQDIDPNNPRAAVDTLQHELDWDQNPENAGRTPTQNAPGRWSWTSTAAGKNN